MIRIAFLLLLFAPLFATDEIVVHLSTKESLMPVNLAPIQAKESGFEQSYLAELEKVLRFDFAHNGKTEVAATATGGAKLEAEVKQKILKVKITPPAGSVKGVEGVVLTGTLAKDRQLLHTVHDTLFEALFHTKGIAETRILYTVRTRKGDNALEWKSDVWESDYDGGNAHQLTYEGSICVTPAFIPPKENGRCRNFLYVSYKAGQPKIFAAALEEGIGKRLTYFRGNQLMPTISPSLDKIAFISDVTGNPDLFIQDYSAEEGLKDKPRQIFCAPGATQGTPTFSPDGKKLAFVSNKDGTPRIYILAIPAPGASVKNLNPKMISKKTRENTSPAWSPDGKKIAYSALTSGTRQIWIYDVVKGEEMQLTEGPGHKENPTWAPNSEHLIFNSSAPTAAELFMINLYQKEAVKISKGPGEKRFPAWEPRL